MLRSINIGRYARWIPDSIIETTLDNAQGVSLTFDDGPEPSVLPKLLDLLDKFKISATFFCVGHRMVKNDHLVRRIIDAGHSIGNHSFYHRRFFDLTIDQQWYEIQRVEELLNGYGIAGKLFRPPQGRIDPMLALKLKGEGFRILHWNVDSRDYSQDANRVDSFLKTTTLKHGDIVLMHDDHELCCDVLKKWLPIWLSQGLQFTKI